MQEPHYELVNVQNVYLQNVRLLNGFTCQCDCHLISKTWWWMTSKGERLVPLSGIRDMSTIEMSSIATNLVPY